MKYQKNTYEARQQVEGPITDPSQNSYATVSKSHQWTSNIKVPNTFKTEEKWLTHTIDSLLKRVDAIKAQKSRENKPFASSASQLCESTLPVPASEHTNESRKLNSASAIGAIDVTSLVWDKSRSQRPSRSCASGLVSSAIQQHSKRGYNLSLCGLFVFCFFFV